MPGGWISSAIEMSSVTSESYTTVVVPRLKSVSADVTPGMRSSLISRTLGHAGQTMPNVSNRFALIWVPSAERRRDASVIVWDVEALRSPGR